MSALAQCDAFAFIYDQAGDPAPDVLVVLKRVLDASGNPILLGPKTTLTDSAGSFHFTLPELATAFISARASALWNCPEGRAFTVPPGPSGELVPDFSLPPSTLVEPPLVYVGDVLSIPKASATQDGYLSAADFVAFEAGAGEMGVTQINTGAGLTGGPITDTGTIGLLPISGVAGTWSNPSSITINAYGQVVAIAGVADTTSPVISAINATSITSSGATILWTTDDPSDSQVEYGTTTSYGTSTTIDATPRTSHSVPITGTAPLTLYHYRVKSRNTSGLLNASGDNTFATTATADTTAPVITLTPVTVITNANATINWTTNEASDSQVDYSIDTSYGTHSPITNPAPPGVTTHAVTLTGLTASTLYHFRVNSKDAAGNPATPVTGTFTTAALGASLLTGLYAYWQMEAFVGGNIVDVVGTLDMTPAGAPIIDVGKIGNGYSTNGGTGTMYAPATIDLTPGFTLTGWVNIAVILAGVGAFIGKGDAIAGTLALYAYYFESAGEWRVQWGPAGQNLLSLPDTTPVGAGWQFICLTFDGPSNTMTISINNDPARKATLIGTVAPVFTNTFTGIGSMQQGASGYNMAGIIDEVGLWSRVLTGAEITSLYNSGAGITYPFTGSSRDL